MSFLNPTTRAAQKQIIAIILSIIVAVGIVFLILFFTQPSEPGNQIFLGLSAIRVFIGAVFVGLLVANIAALLLAASTWWPQQASFEGRIAGLFSDHRNGILVALYTLLILTGSFLLLTIPPVIRPLAFLTPVSVRLGGLFIWLFSASLLLIIMLRIVGGDILRKSRMISYLDGILAIVGLFVLVFVVYAHIADLIGWINKTRYSYWNLLAEQFLQGKLYLEHPPYTHDLTLYNGKWYVPMPPLPAVLMMPLVYWMGAENISTSYLSMLFSALNGVLVYLILQRFLDRKWIDISRSGTIWMVVVFLFGTPHLWVGISGRAWFVSQILTVLFIALSVYAALRSWSPWVIGILLGLAVLARPNSLMTWPFLFAIGMQIIKEDQGSIDLKRVLLWISKTILPVLLAVVALLAYNYLRFEKFLDFGYTTINGAPSIVQNARTYGVFSPHFIPANLKVIFFRLPRLHWGYRWPIEPSTTGMSIFLTTPPLLYLFRRYKRQWWILGAWSAVLLNLILLSFYHNTGADQFGYRYILDTLVPLITLLAVGFHKRLPWHFLLLVLVSIVINIYGTDWFMNG